MEQLYDCYSRQRKRIWRYLFTKKNYYKKEYLYFRITIIILGKNLIEFKLVDKEIIVISVKEVSKIICDKMELVLCYNIAYTFYKYRCDDNSLYCLESYNLDTGDIDFVFKDVSSDDTVIEINGDKYAVSSNLKIMSFQHCSLVEKNNLVNDSFSLDFF